MSIRALHGVGLALCFAFAGGARAGGGAAEAAPLRCYVKAPTWADTLLASRAAFRTSESARATRAATAARLWARTQEDFPIHWDWVLQDHGPGFASWFEAHDKTDLERKLLRRVLDAPEVEVPALRSEFEALCQADRPADDPCWLSLYAKVCEARRAHRLRDFVARTPRVVFTKHRTIRPSFFAYTEGQSDAQHERHFLPGSELCLLEMSGLHGRERTLVADPTGAIRDPAVSWEGDRVLFAWKKSLDEDDYHLYELDMASGRVRQVTFGRGFADYEPAYLPNGDLVFASTRCVQTVDCWWTEVSNLYTCDPAGRFLRRLTFDQVHSIFPTVLDDGRVIYTRWDYNDRGQIFPQALFQMNPDGTGQTEFYGNNSWFPTTIAHARGIPGTQKVLAVFCGHHTAQAGKLGVLDPAKGRQENTGAQLAAPLRETRAERIDGYGQSGELFQYPFPLNDREFLVTYAPLGWERSGERRGDADFAIYWMDLEGRRELLASDPRLPCQQPVPLAPHARPPVRPSLVDYRQTTGTLYVQDVHAGPGLAGVPRGVVKKLRVVALEFRPAGVGENHSHGPGGGALASTPISIGNGSWDVKVVLGDATVRQDGSAFFVVPARTPLYLQALDDRGYAVQTMRSWTTLQPGENQSCAGCHEPKNSSPPAQAYPATLALKAGPQPLEPFHGPPRGFSFPKEVQPILDRHCTRCHYDRSRRMRSPHPGDRASSTEPPGASAPSASPPIEPAFSLLAETTEDPKAKRRWSDAYLALVGANREDLPWAPQVLVGNNTNRLVNWIGAQSVPEPLPPWFAGTARSELMPLLERGHKGARLSRAELETLACWIDLLVPYCGDYTEAHAWSEDELQKYQRYLDKRRRMEALERRNIEELIAHRAGAGHRPVQAGVSSP
jgi:hypothetical protein